MQIPSTSRSFRSRSDTDSIDHRSIEMTTQPRSPTRSLRPDGLPRPGHAHRVPANPPAADEAAVAPGTSAGMMEFVPRSPTFSPSEWEVEPWPRDVSVNDRQSYRYTKITCVLILIALGLAAAVIVPSVLFCNKNKPSCKKDVGGAGLGLTPSYSQLPRIP